MRIVLVQGSDESIQSPQTERSCHGEPWMEGVSGVLRRVAIQLPNALLRQCLLMRI